MPASLRSYLRQVGDSNHLMSLGHLFHHTSHFDGDLAGNACIYFVKNNGRHSGLVGKHILDAKHEP